MASMFPSFKGSSMLFSVVYAVYAYKQSIKEEFNSYDLHVTNHYTTDTLFFFIIPSTHLGFLIIMPIPYVPAKCFCEGMASASIIEREFEKKNETIFKSSTKVFR